MLKLFDSELYYGNIEYKALIHFSNNNKIERFITQLLFRIREGNGKAIYIIGITDSGYLFINNLKLLFYSLYNFETKILLKLNNIKKNHRIFQYKNYIYCIYTLIDINNNNNNNLEY